MTEETNVVEEVVDGNPPEDSESHEPVEERIQVGLHPLGGLAISVTGTNGARASAQMGVEEAWQLVGHLQALTGFVINQAFMAQAQQEQQAREQMSRIVLPGRLP